MAELFLLQASRERALSEEVPQDALNEDVLYPALVVTVHALQEEVQHDEL